MRLTILLVWFMLSSGAVVISIFLARRVWAIRAQRTLWYMFWQLVTFAVYNTGLATIAYQQMQTNLDMPVSVALIILTIGHAVLVLPHIAFSAHLLGLTNGGTPKIKDHV